MPPLDNDAVRAAAARLLGHVVATPLIGAVQLPGYDVPAQLRVKPEVLQPGGSIWFRAASHHLVRQLGGVKGIVAWGSPRLVLAVAAASSQRVPVVGFVVGQPEPSVAAMFAAYGCEARVCTSPDRASAAALELRRAQGFAILPPEGADDDWQLGLATVGYELAAELPADHQLVLVSPAVLAAPLAAGLVAGGSAAVVRGVDAEQRAHVQYDAARLVAAVAAGLRLCCDEAGIAGLQHAVDEGVAAACVVLPC